MLALTDSDEDDEFKVQALIENGDPQSEEESVEDC
jgi:hypothetical protein